MSAAYRFPPSKFSSSFSTRQPYSSIFRSTGATSSSGTFYRNNVASSNSFKPSLSSSSFKPPTTAKSLVQSRIAPSRSTYASASQKSLPLAPHQTMKPFVFKADNSNENAEKDKDMAKDKENVAPNRSPPAVPKHPSKNTTVFHNFKASATSLPIHVTMKPVVFKYSTEEPVKENIQRPPPSVTSSVKSFPQNSKLNTSEDSELWTDDDDEDAKSYRTTMAGVKAPQAKAKPVVKKSEPETPKPRETNPFKIEAEKAKEVKEMKPEILAPRVAKSTNIARLTRAAFDDIKKQKEKDLKRINGYNNDDYLENYLTLPFSIPETKMRVKLNQPFFEVELVEFTSPSQFMFQHSYSLLQILTEEME